MERYIVSEVLQDQMPHSIQRKTKPMDKNRSREVWVHTPADISWNLPTWFAEPRIVRLEEGEYSSSHSTKLLTFYKNKADYLLDSDTPKAQNMKAVIHQSDYFKIKHVSQNKIKYHKHCKMKTLWDADPGWNYREFTE